MRIVAAVVLVASLAHAEPWEQRVNAFRAKATAERKRLGLDAEKAKKAYPTPEVRFGVAPNASVVACPGETSTVFLHGKLAPGTLVGAISPEVQIVKEQFTPDGWLGTISVQAGAPAGSALFEVIAPVSGISNTVALKIGCARQWVIDLSSGERLVLQVVDGESRASGEWRRGSTVLGTRAFSVSMGGEQFSLTQEESAEEIERKTKATQQLSGAGSKDEAGKQQAMMVAMQQCATLPPAQMGACMQKYTGDLQAMMARQQEGLKAMDDVVTSGCQQLTGTLKDKKLAGQASGCAGQKLGAAVKFKGEAR